MRWLRAVVVGGALAVGAMVVAVAPVSGASVPISIVDNAYQPSSATVSVGDTVVWCNNGANGHSVVPDEGDFGTGALDPGECSAPFRATTLGTFTYDCSLENMRGTLTVRQAPPQTTTQRPPASTAPPRAAPPPGAPPPTGSPRTAASRSATATTGDTAGESAPPVSFVAPELADAPPPTSRRPRSSYSVRRRHLPSATSRLTKWARMPTPVRRQQSSCRPRSPCWVAPTSRGISASVAAPYHDHVGRA